MCVCVGYNCNSNPLRIGTLPKERILPKSTFIETSKQNKLFLDFVSDPLFVDILSLSGKKCLFVCVFVSTVVTKNLEQYLLKFSHRYFANLGRNISIEFLNGQHLSKPCSVRYV